MCVYQVVCTNAYYIHVVSVLQLTLYPNINNNVNFAIKEVGTTSDVCCHPYNVQVLYNLFTCFLVLPSLLIFVFAIQHPQFVITLYL